MAGIRVADRLADPQSQEGLVAGVGQRVDGLREHAGGSSVHPGQQLEDKIQPIAEGKERRVGQFIKQKTSGTIITKNILKDVKRQYETKS